MPKSSNVYFINRFNSLALCGFRLSSFGFWRISAPNSLENCNLLCFFVSALFSAGFLNGVYGSLPPRFRYKYIPYSEKKPNRFRSPATQRSAIYILTISNMPAITYDECFFNVRLSGWLNIFHAHPRAEKTVKNHPIQRRQYNQKVYRRTSYKFILSF